MLRHVQGQGCGARGNYVIHPPGRWAQRWTYSVVRGFRRVIAMSRWCQARITVVTASTERDFETAFADLAQLRTAGLVISGDLFFLTAREQFVALARTSKRDNEFSASDADCHVTLPAGVVSMQ
jgi:hypothetical protein